MANVVKRAPKNVKPKSKKRKRAKYEIRKVQFHAGNCKSLDTVIPIIYARQLKITKGDRLRIVKKGSKIIISKMK